MEAPIPIDGPPSGCIFTIFWLDVGPNICVKIDFNLTLFDVQTNRIKPNQLDQFGLKNSRTENFGLSTENGRKPINQLNRTDYTLDQMQKNHHPNLLRTPVRGKSS